MAAAATRPKLVVPVTAVDDCEKQVSEQALFPKRADTEEAGARRGGPDTFPQHSARSLCDEPHEEPQSWSPTRRSFQGSPGSPIESISQIRQRHDDCLRQAEQARRGEAELQQQVTRLQSQLEDVQQASHDQSNQASQTFWLMRRIDELEASNVLSQQQATELQSENCVLQSQVCALQAEGAALETSNSELQREIAGLRETQDSLHQQVGSLSNHASGLEQRLHGSLDRNTAEVLRTLINTGREENTELRDRNRRLELHVEELERFLRLSSSSPLGVDCDALDCSDWSRGDLGSHQNTPTDGYRQLGHRSGAAGLPQVAE